MHTTVCLSERHDELGFQSKSTLHHYPSTEKAEIKMSLRLIHLTKNWDSFCCDIAVDSAVRTIPQFSV